MNKQKTIGDCVKAGWEGTRPCTASVTPTAVVFDLNVYFLFSSRMDVRSNLSGVVGTHSTLFRRFMLTPYVKYNLHGYLVLPLYVDVRYNNVCGLSH